MRTKRTVLFGGALGVSIMMTALMLGFFYAWICSTMWGLDQTDPRTAIGAMQAMNASVRNIAFGPVFFGTPFILLLTAMFGWQSGYKHTSIMVSVAGFTCLFGYLVLTATINVPMNESLGIVEIPASVEKAEIFWRNYSDSWQFWNVVRFGFTALALGLLVFVVLFVWPNERS